MNAVDTNILVRWITRDDPAQARIADSIMAEPVIVSLTVLLELAWVLGGKTYRFDRIRRADALRAVVGLKTAIVPLEAGVLWAIDRSARGADFADMIHLISAGRAMRFLSFEKKLSKLAGSDSPVAIETLA